ncbi:MAG: YqgE/AlgH family protein [Acidimicrobiales bacterium]
MAPSAIRGRLLVANPELPDPNFDRTVVLVLAHGDDGALGVVLNRPSETGLDETLPRWEVVASVPPVVFVGGPVSQDTVIGVGGAPDGMAADEAAEGSGWVPITGELGTLDLQQDPDDLPAALRGLRIFVGYAGWGPGQLESEIAAGGWWVVDADVDDAFSEDPARLWQRVLRRQPGHLALVSSYPADPELN